MELLADGRPLEALDSHGLRALLRTHGVVVLRGFGVRAASFAALVRRVFKQTKATPAHRGHHPLHRVIQTVTPGLQAMGFHSEYAHLPDGVDAIAFWAEVPSGDTMVCDGASLFASVSDDTRAFFQAHRITNVAWHEPAAWIPACETDDVAEVQRQTAHLRGYRVEPGPMGGIFTRYTVSAVVHLPHVPAPCLVANVFPGAYAALHVEQEDGSALPATVVDDVIQTAERIKTVMRWEPGDVVLLDNRRMLHARGVQAPGRRCWAVLGMLD